MGGKLKLKVASTKSVPIHLKKSHDKVVSPLLAVNDSQLGYCGCPVTCLSVVIGT